MPATPVVHLLTTKVSDGQSWHTWITYENRSVLPRAFVVHSFEVVQEGGALLSRLAGPGFDPREVVLLEEHPAEGNSCVLVARAVIVAGRDRRR